LSVRCEDLTRLMKLRRRKRKRRRRRRKKGISSIYNTETHELSKKSMYFIHHGGAEEGMDERLLGREPLRGITLEQTLEQISQVHTFMRRHRDTVFPRQKHACS